MSNEFIGEEFMSSGMKIAGSNAPASLSNSRTHQLQVEELDRMINNPNEHPDIRANAKKLKDKLFPETVEESPIVESPEPKEKIIKRSPPVKVSLPKQSKTDSIYINDEVFNDILEEFSSDLYSAEIGLLSSPEKSIRLKALTVEEYKFLAKNLQDFENTIQVIANNPEATYKDKIIPEFILNNALFTILERCIVGDVDINTLTIYDWIYILLYIRVISRGNDVNLRINTKTSNAKVSIDLVKLLNHIYDYRDNFNKSLTKIINVKDNFNICIFPETIGDMKFVQNYFKKNDETMSFLNGAICIKTIIRDNSSFIMNHEQRIRLANTLSHDTMEDVLNNYSESNDIFFQLINDFVQESNPGVDDIEALDISDFILFFYDF